MPWFSFVTNFGQKIILLFKKIINKNFCLERINIFCAKIAVANCHKNNKIKSVKKLILINKN
jgi:hypothetical protein